MPKKTVQNFLKLISEKYSIPEQIFCNKITLGHDHPEEPDHFEDEVWCLLWPPR